MELLFISAKLKIKKKKIRSHFQYLSNNYFHQQINNFNTIISKNIKDASISERNLIKKY
jgi:hypothetical protein